MSINSPQRPPTAKDVETMMNGRMTLLGVIRSTGAAVDNSSATSLNAVGGTGGFYATVQQGAVPTNFALTLAGRVLLLQASAAGSVLAATAPIGTGTQVTVTNSTVMPTATTQPGPKLQAEERVPFIMGAEDGWLQFIPVTGSADLLVWELT